MGDALDDVFEAGPIIGGTATTGGDAASLVTCPHDRRERIGTVRITTPAQADAAIAARGRRPSATGTSWAAPSARRSSPTAADLFERDKARLMAVIVREAGKTLDDAQGDVREAIDFLRYYAAQARRLFVGPVALPGPTGERNTLTLHGRGVFACISPWNFPLAIFTGQVAAALAAGNAVRRQARRADADHRLPRHQAAARGGRAAERAAPVAGQRPPRRSARQGHARQGHLVHRIERDRHGRSRRRSPSAATPSCPFIAETGGINAMIADSTALPEQVVRDAVRSAFNSAGQRCSAARVLFVQEEVADRTIDMLVGAIQALDVGDPFDYATDIGPVIDEEAQDALDGHKIRMQREGRQLVDLLLPESCRAGSYVTPAAFEIDDLGVLEREVFGPILHVVRYRARLARQGRRRHQRHGLRPDARPAQPHRGGGRLRRRACARRQHLRQSQPDRRRRRRAAVRRRGAVGHRPQGGRAQYPVRLRHRARALDRRHLDRREPGTAHRRDDYRPLTAGGILPAGVADRHAVGEWLVYWARG